MDYQDGGNFLDAHQKADKGRSTSSVAADEAGSSRVAGGETSGSSRYQGKKGLDEFLFSLEMNRFMRVWLPPL